MEYLQTNRGSHRAAGAAHAIAETIKGLGCSCAMSLVNKSDTAVVVLMLCVLV
jgi:hypothetical protein